ncbi:DNA-processing protein DprA [Acidipropionibacterium acidipropionici]|uniref:DNA processing protein DprA n=1 Tax=Acidipropionibacterium acidipropionici TaxID=1748 RepID=A0AAC8YD35_9ACTN|nr:DNA-processing protein DprA [Acidipropionibacterium acidipropionici]AMS04508.1 DNA processing protein DprA [Acidipropionibacterium acidipropionici]AOZ46001.1 DNA processing protein DprA [Acidipropionibacterium acidipropionici]AZP37976.1 DNA-processing protein DprA [Acidipropionibacterium acidipropionici]
MASIAEQVTGERMARMVLSMIAEPDDQATGRVLAQVGGVETLALIGNNEPIPGMARAEAMVRREHLAPHLHQGLAARAVEAEERGIGTLIPADPAWPAGVNDLGVRGPYVLWTRGATSLLTSPFRERVTVTGARAATAYGMEVASDLAGNLANDERVIVAGGAFGIEGAAHWGALARGGHTVAVLAGGVDRAYPSAHRELLERIGDVGLLVSELPPGAAPSRQRFVARGRLLAGLSGVTVIPEASLRAGAMRTAAHAHALGRGVGAVLGPVTSVTSDGPHDLIKRGITSMVTTTSDVTVLLDSGPEASRNLSRSEPGAEFTCRRPSSSEEPGRSI